jgi:hypothetical protein
MPMVESITAWQCIGCGNLEAPQTCIGVCEYRKVKLVDATVHAATVQGLEQQLADCRRFLETFVRINPRPEQWESSFRALQDAARRLLAQRAGP